MKIGLLLTLALAPGMWAQDLKLSAKIEALSKIAKETVDVTLDGAMLRVAEQFLSDRDADQAKAKRILRGLNRVSIKVFEFDRPGAYSPADLDDIRAQLKSPGWSRLVEVRSKKDDNVDVYAKLDGSAMNGLVVVAGEERELTIVQIDGPIRPEDLAGLNGRLGFKLPLISRR